MTGIVILIIAIMSSWFKRSGIFAILVSLGSAFIGYSAISCLFWGTAEAFQMTLPEPWGTVIFSFTPLSALFGLIFAFGSTMTVWYGLGYLKKYDTSNLASHLFWLGALILSLQLTILARHSLMFFLAWELMSMSSFFCLIYEHQKSVTRQAGHYYIVFMQVGAFLLLTGFAMLYAQTGSMQFDTYKNIPLLPMLFLFAGFAFKAGFFPFYSWLPIAHPAAPSHVSGLMSGLMLKTGIYGIIMLLGMTVPSLNLMYGFMILSLATAFLGVVHALTETDIKKILAYSSIENIGIIGLGISLAWIGRLTNHPLMSYLALAGALMHSINHSLFKPLLFYLSGNIYQQTHTRELDLLGGLQKRMPHTGVLFLAGSMAISALPLFNGFVSELLIYFGLLQGFVQSELLLNLISIIGAICLAFVGTLAMFAFARLYGLSFLGEPRSAHSAKAHEAGINRLVIPYILMSMCLLLGIGGVFVLKLLNPVIVNLGFTVMDSTLCESFYKLGIAFSCVILLVLALYSYRKRIIKPAFSQTWGCGYEKPSPKMQYTGNSLIHPLAYFIKPFIHKQDKILSDTNHFPQSFGFHAKVHDFIHEFCLRPGQKVIALFLGLFTGVQRGRTQIYITYSLVFLIIMLIWAILGVK
jgi:formate hydrogenlyase subunit 3/multisubunit Na+/H+ antiporter MnhD subunit